MFHFFKYNKLTKYNQEIYHIVTLQKPYRKELTITKFILLYMWFWVFRIWRKERVPVWSDLSIYLLFSLRQHFLNPNFQGG